jgi:hypothetical protein
MKRDDWTKVFFVKGQLDEGWESSRSTEVKFWEFLWSFFTFCILVTVAIWPVFGEGNHPNNHFLVISMVMLMRDMGPPRSHRPGSQSSPTDEPDLPDNLTREPKDEKIAWCASQDTLDKLSKL